VDEMSLLSGEKHSYIADQDPFVLDKCISIIEMQRFSTRKGSSISHQWSFVVNKGLFAADKCLFVVEKPLFEHSRRSPLEMSDLAQLEITLSITVKPLLVTNKGLFLAVT